MQRTICGGCGSANLEPFLDLGSSPLADRFPKTADDYEETWPLQVAVCTECWLAQLLDVVPDQVLWDDYGFYSGTSPAKVAYHADYARWAFEEFGWQARRLVVEVGCNDGDLLRHFHDHGFPVVGVDPAEGPVKEARDRGMKIECALFGKVWAEQAREKYGPAGLILANHVAAHVADPADFFGGLAHLLAPDGRAVIEVQYLADLLAGHQFDHVYHEHRFFYSVGSLSAVAARHNLRVVDLVRSEQQGGSVRVVLGHGWDRHPHGWVEIERRRWGLQSMTPYAAFQPVVDYVRGELYRMVQAEVDARRRVAAYAATAKSTTLLNACELGPTLEYVEDTTPHKIGRVTPGTHVPIVAPGDRKPPDTFLLTAWNYLPAVLRREQTFLEAGGRWLVPIPLPVLL